MEKNVLVVGAGITGIQASLDLAEAGISVYLVEKAPSIGGRMAQFDKIYPTLDSSLEMLMPKMVKVAEHPNIKLLTNTEVAGVEGSLESYRVKILRKPRYVNENKCTGCGACIEVCPVSVPDRFNEGLSQTRAISIYSPNAVPKVATINPEYCIQLSGKGKCAKCAEVCEPKAVDFEQKPETSSLNVGAIILAVGAEIFDATKAPEMGYGRFKNVVSNIEFERILAVSGPTGVKFSARKTAKRQNV